MGSPLSITFSGARDMGEFSTQWDDWIGIYPVATCCDFTQLQNFVGGNGSGEWAYHASGEAGAGTVTVVPTQAVDYYVLLLGGASGYLELTDPDNRLRITVCEAGGCPGAGTASYDLCFGATSADTVTHDFETGSAALPGGWSAVDDTPVSSPGDWYVVDPSTLYGAGIHVDGWAAYENSNVWGNYPGDNQLSGSYLINDAVYDSFIAEFDVFSADNDGLGFLFGYQTLDDHFTATEINDQWPSPPADGYGGPHQKLRQRSFWCGPP